MVDDLHWEMDRGSVTLLILLNLLVAFNTSNQEILLDCLSRLRLGSNILAMIRPVVCHGLGWPWTTRHVPILLRLASDWETTERVLRKGSALFGDLSVDRAPRSLPQQDGQRSILGTLLAMEKGGCLLNCHDWLQVAPGVEHRDSGSNASWNSLFWTALGCFHFLLATAFVWFGVCMCVWWFWFYLGDKFQSVVIGKWPLIYRTLQGGVAMLMLRAGHLQLKAHPVRS